MTRVETKMVHYICDICKARMKTAYQGENVTLWTDRDVTARARIHIDFSISYAAYSNDICDKCAVGLLEKHIETLKGKIEHEKNS